MRQEAAIGILPGFAPGFRPGFQFLSQPPVGPWSPSAIGPSLSAWYDASDAASISQSGGAVSAWADKSVSSGARTGTPNNLSQATGSAQPTYSASGFVSDGGPKVTFLKTSSQMMSMTSAVSYAGGTGLSVFALVEQNAATATKSILGHTSAGGMGFYLTEAQANSGKLALVRANQAFLQSSSGTVNTGAHVVGAIASSSGQTVDLDGTLSTTATDPAFTSGLNEVGACAGLGYFDGAVREVIIVSGAATANLRQAVEGYLAYRGGIQANLPSGHPYKSSPPQCGALIN